MFANHMYTQCISVHFIYIVSHHQETRAHVRVSANKVCKHVLIISIFTCTLAMDDQEGEDRNKYLDGRMQ